MKQMTSEVKQQQLEWRRTQVLELASKGYSQREIAKELQIDLTAVNRDIQFLRQQAHDTLHKHGSLITYILLHALRPRDIAINGTSKMKVKLSGKEKSEQATRWVENTISPFWILDAFKKLRTVKEGLAIWGESSPPEFQRLTEKQNKRRKMQPQDPLWTQYELDEDTFNKLTTAFANIYPEINAQLEYIRKTLPD
jgi:predicted transcriptional regulator